MDIFYFDFVDYFVYQKYYLQSIEAWTVSLLSFLRAPNQIVATDIN